MKRIMTLLTVAFCMLALAAAAQTPGDSAKFEGRWDLTLTMDGKENPSWLEIRHSGFKTWVGHFVGVAGSSRPISRVTIKGNKFSFAIPPQWEEGEQDLRVEGTLNADKLSGTMIFPDGKSYSWTGVRAPSLRVVKEVQFEKPISLIPTTGIEGWKALGANQWVVENGVLRSPKSGANLVTERKFQDFRMHLEFRYPPGSNSGVYLRGRYEVQISDSHGKEPLPGELGGVYGFITPSEQVAKIPGEWQTYDITLIGRRVTVVANGKIIINNQEIPGITGGALDSKEGEPGPIMLQGDHGPIEYRNITITPGK